MAAIAATPIFMKNVFLTLKTTVGTALEFQCHVTEARLQVTPGDITTVRTLCSSGVFSSANSPEYALVLVGVQDWDTTAGSEGLAAFLWQNEGAVLSFVLNIHSEASSVGTPTQPRMTGSVLCVPGDYGGVIGEYAELSVELPCTAKPTLTTAAVLMAEAEAAKGTKAA
jgi:hypothetical protein